MKKNENYSMPPLGAILKERREAAYVSAKDVSELLSKRGFEVKYTTYMGYESGNSMPNADVFLALCDIFQITDILRTFGFGEGSFPVFSAHALVAHPYFNLVEKFCCAHKIDSRPVFDYFTDPDNKVALSRIFLKGRPPLNAEIDVGAILKLNNYLSLYAWGAQNGCWNDPSQQMSPYSRLDAVDQSRVDNFINSLLESKTDSFSQAPDSKNAV